MLLKKVNVVSQILKYIGYKKTDTDNVCFA